MGPGGRAGQAGGEVTREEFDELAVLFLFVCVVEHFAIFSGVVGAVLGSPGLVGASKEGDLFGNEFPGGCRCEVTVVGWVVAQLGLVAVDCLRVLVPAEGFVYGFFPWEGEVVDVGEGVGGAPFGVSVLAKEMALDLEEEVVLGLVGEHVWCPAVAI